ncbi:replication initiation protein (plasmid) [Acinetobacter variabilis]|uniref:Replication initiation protein n=1 Tax=Acinetobacter variabilis TaxID=70346 RepID=A0A8F6QVY0_9GAMM|nr:replication initiation protein [Acinetobacter variabilis]QXR21059.1 replication initiation protein [Acinetobacter variabilis]
MDSQLDTLVVDDHEYPIQKPIAQYPAEYTVMQNRMIEAWNSMSIDEKRVFILASPIVRLNPMNESSKFTITAKDFAEACNIEIGSAYSQLKKAADDLRGRYFSYINTKGNRVSVHWVIRIEYGDGKISFYFTNEVLFMLSIFNNNHPYTKFTIKEVLQLKGSHSIQLYQLLKQYESIGHRDFKEEEFRNIFELKDKYSLLWNLKKRVIVPAISEINKSTGLQVSFSNIKDGKKITGFRFLIEKKGTSNRAKEKKKEKSLTINQIDFFSNKLAHDLAFASQYSEVGESYEDFAKRISEHLRDPTKVKEYTQYLKQLGFK